MVEMNVQPYVDEYDVIDDDVWIGANYLVIAGEKIGDGSMYNY
jgi:acetyltransferase-like isoleucine patch superfamily enzyme